MAPADVQTTPAEGSATFMAVKGRGEGQEPDPAQARRVARSAVEQRLADAAPSAAAAHGPLLGALLLAATGPGLLEARPDTPASLLSVWAVATLGLAAALALWPRHVRLRQARVPAALAAGLASVCVALPAWWATPAWQVPVAMIAVIWGALAAVLLAPMRHGVGAAGLGVPLALAALAAGNGVWQAPWVLTGLALLLAVAVAAEQRRRGWRRNMSALIEQGDRIRQLERERAQVLSRKLSPHSEFTQF